MEMESSCKVFIGGISWETSEDRLRDYFQNYGEVSQVVIIKDRFTGRARGFGFIVFLDSNVAARVVMQKHLIDGKSVEAKKAVPRDDHMMILNKSNSSRQGSPGPAANTRKIFVGGLASSVTDAELKNYFSQFGKVMDHVVMYDHKTQRPRGFGFITYDSDDAVDRVLQKTFHELDGKVVEVKMAVPKETSPTPNRNLMSKMNTFLNDYTQGYSLSPILGYGAKPEGGRYSPAAGNRGSFSPFGHGFGIELNFEATQKTNGGFGRPFSPGYNANLSMYGGQGNGSVTRNHLWGNNAGAGYVSNSVITGRLNGNAGVGSIGEKWGTVGEGRSNHGYSNAELGFGYGRNNGMGIESRRGGGGEGEGGGGVYMSSLGWGMSGERGMHGFGYMNNTEELMLA
uniref:Heterogeneous nuclear ribonucleoprotein 1 n=1 Tax=Noccaea caerulescens TaxID=107243 RepID=A0A1J3JX90_NOCCA